MPPDERNTRETQEKHKRAATVPDSADQSAIQEALQYLRNTAKKREGNGEVEMGEGVRQFKKKNPKQETRRGASVKTSSLPSARRPCVPERR